MKITMALNFFLIMIIFVSFKESLQMADIKETHLKLSESRVFQIPNALLQSSKQKSMYFLKDDSIYSLSYLLIIDFFKS